MTEVLSRGSYQIDKKLFDETCEKFYQTDISYMYFSDGDTHKCPKIYNANGDNYKKLAEELIAKKINKCTWIKSITRKQMYTHVIIIVTYDHGGKSVYNLYNSNV